MQAIIHKLKENYKRMKKYYLIILMALLFAGCSDDVWLDHETPKVYIPKNGFSINKAWLQGIPEYTVELSAYCSGVRPANRNKEVTVNYTLAPELITEYNNDITQEYSGKIIELPADCYSFTSDKIVIPQGMSHGEVGININLQKMKDLGLKPNEVKYAIPVKLNSTSDYILQDQPKMLGAIYCITVEEPSFYFWDNRGEDIDMKEIGEKVLYGGENKTNDYKISSFGVPAGVEYTLSLAVNLTAVPKGGILLPENAYEMPATVTIPATATAIDVVLPIKLINNNIAFKTTYYLPVSIKSASKFGPHATKSTLLLKINVKNDYEWNYKSLLNIECEGNQRTSGYSVTKVPTSESKDMLRIQMITNNTIAGATATGTSSSTFNNKYYYLKIIPADNKNKYNIELVKEATSPASLELIPDKESYYDWDYETFHLFYRFKDNSGKWVNVSEILEAQ